MSEWDLLIHSYTRGEAVADGTLIDVTETAKEAGFRWPVAMTAAVWADCVAWTESDTQRTGVPQDEAGRLWDVIWMASRATQRAVGAELYFEVRRVPRDGHDHEARSVELKAVAGPGDEGEPVVTIMRPDED